jgi:hypothetical protein
MKTSTFWLVITACAAMLVAAAPQRVAACSCARPVDGARGYFRGADAVLLAYVQATVKQGGKSWRPLQVVWALKGKAKAGSTVRIDGALHPCSAIYKTGQFALVFVRKGRTHLCAGNYALSVMRRDLPALLRAAAAYHGKKVRVPAALLKAGLERALKGYLHGRRSIPLSTKALKRKRTIRIGKSSLRVTRQRPKHGIILRHALQVGPIALVQGSYPAEGVTFTLLLQAAPKSTAKRVKVLYRSVAERKTKLPPTKRNRMP